MAEFPRLQTGAVCQHPLASEVECRARVLRFLDGSEQRIPRGGVTRRWRIHYDALTEAEAAAVEQFVNEYQQTQTPFAFTDPSDNTIHARCRVETDRLEVRYSESAGVRTSMVIAEEVE
jgi:phage-related protein